MCVALSKRVLVEYYIAEANGYKPKVIFKCTNYRTSRVSKTHTYIKLNDITKHIREAKCIFETKFYGLKAHDQKANKETYLRSLLLKRVAFKEYEAYFSKLATQQSYKQ